MAKPFFNSPERIAALIQEIGEWHGTKFWAGAGRKAKKGVGADCVSFVEKVLVNIGAIKPIEWPPYVIMGAGTSMLDLMLSTLETLPEFRRIWTPPQPGAESTDPDLNVAISLAHLELTTGDGLKPGDVIARTIELRGGDFDYHHLAIFIGDNTLMHMRQERGLSEANIYDRHAVKQLRAVYRIYDVTEQAGNAGDGGGGRPAGETNPPV